MKTEIVKVKGYLKIKKPMKKQNLCEHCKKFETKGKAKRCESCIVENYHKSVFPPCLDENCSICVRKLHIESDEKSI